MDRSFARARRRLAAAVAAALLLAMPDPGDTAVAAVFSPDSFTLDNGLQVVVISNHRAPIVTHMVWYKVGAADEAPGKSGIAHFLEHLMFKGTETLAPGEFSKIVAANGGQENAFTSQDYTGYFQNVAVDRLETVMRLEADRMANLTLTDDVVLPERDVVREERRARTDNDPDSILAEQAQAALFQNHPYGTPIIGWEHELMALTTEDAVAFYRRHYAPNNAVLVVAGDVTVDQVRPLAEKYYGAIPRRDIPPRLRPQEPEHKAPVRLELRDHRVRQPTWSRTYLAPSYNGAGSEHAYALQVLADVLGGGGTSRLHRTLVVEQKIAAAAGASYDSLSLDDTTFTFYGTPLPGGEVGAVEAAIDGQIAALLRDGVTAAEVARAKLRLQRAAIFARDSLATGARIIGMALTSGRTIEDVEAWPERIGAVTADQVVAAARAVLRPTSSVTAVLLPAADDGDGR